MHCKDNPNCGQLYVPVLAKRRKQHCFKCSQRGHIRAFRELSFKKAVVLHSRRNRRDSLRLGVFTGDRDYRNDTRKRRRLSGENQEQMKHDTFTPTLPHEAKT